MSAENLSTRDFAITEHGRAQTSVEVLERLAYGRPVDLAEAEVLRLLAADCAAQRAAAEAAERGADVIILAERREARQAEREAVR